MGIALVSVAVVAVAAAPVFGQRGGRRGPGAAADEFGGQDGSSGEFRGRGGFRGMGGAPGEFPGGGGPRGDFRGRGGPQGDFRGRGGPPSGDARGQGRGFQGPFGGADGGERLDRFLREMDADGDGRIEENEVDGRRRNLVEMMAQRAGIPPTFPISVNRLRDALNRAAQAERGSSSTSSGEAGAKKPAEEPLVPGFGIDMGLSSVLSFGQRPSSTATGKTRASIASGSASRTSSSSSSRGGSPSPRGGNNDERTSRFAEAMMRQADRNGNGRLEPDEWNERWGDFREADRNHDGAVTADELAQRLSGFARRGPGGDRGGPANPSGSASSSGSERAGSGSGSPQQPKSYRVPTPTELLPAGLPDWFAQKDANADGQVAMAEFESPRSWTAAAVAEFTRLDLNNDGFITPTECLNVLNPAGAGGQLARAEVASQGPPAAGPSAAPAPGPEGRPTGPVTRGNQGRSVPGPRDRGSQASRRGPSGPAPGGDMGDAWAGFE